MADHLDAVRTRLTAHAGTTALISNRSWYGMLPQDPTLPACVVQGIDGAPTPAMGSDTGNVESRVQVDGYATNRAGAEALRVQMTAALKRFSGTSASTTIDDCFLVTDPGAAYEPETKLWRARQDYMVWWAE